MGLHEGEDLPGPDPHLCPHSTVTISCPPWPLTASRCSGWSTCQGQDSGEVHRETMGGKYEKVSWDEDKWAYINY